MHLTSKKISVEIVKYLGWLRSCYFYVNYISFCSVYKTFCQSMESEGFERISLMQQLKNSDSI